MPTITFDNLQDFKSYILDIDFKDKDEILFNKILKELKECNLDLKYNLFKSMNLKVWIDTKLAYDNSLDIIKLIKMTKNNNLDVNVLYNNISTLKNNNYLVENNKSLVENNKFLVKNKVLDISYTRENKFYFPIYQNFKCSGLNDLLNTYENMLEHPKLFPQYKIKFEIDYKTIL